MQNYTVHGKLGSGGYSNVHLCRDSIGIRYAMKMMSKEKNKRVNVQNEIAMMQRLYYSCRVPRFVDACEDKDSYYIIQELCRGGALMHYCEKNDLYGENTVASIVRGVLRGLCHIHDVRIIHRDIKGGNLIFTDDGPDSIVKIIDFGTARISGVGKYGQTEVDKVIGTPWFIAPESLNRTITFQSDIWSLGVLTYQMLTGCMPFNDRNNSMNPNLQELFKSIFADDPDFSDEKWYGISEDAKEFVKICLDKDFAARPTASDALLHPWLTKTDCQDRFTGTPLVCSPFIFDQAMNARTVVEATNIHKAKVQVNTNVDVRACTSAL